MKPSRILQSMALLLGLTLVAVGCAPEDELPPLPEPEIPVAEETEPQEFANGHWAQDLWLYETISTIDDAGELVDLTDDIFNELTEPTRSFTLPFDAVFHVFEELSPSITDGTGATRNDIDVVAGLLEHEFDFGLAVLGTPKPDASAPIGLHDHVEVDLTFLGDKLQPGDPLIVDYSLLQTRPAVDEPEASNFELLAHRIEHERAFTAGEGDDDEVIVAPFTNVLGVAVAGSTRMSAPGKDISNPYLKGFRDGIKGCRGKSPLGCVRNFFQKSGKGARDSNRLIECNLGTCVDPPPAQDPPKKRCFFRCGGKPPAKVHGDPHLLSFDGLSTDMQGVGEYVLVSGPGLDIHIRTEAMSPSNRTVSTVAMAAVQMGGHTVVVDPHERAARVRIDGEEAAYDPSESLITEMNLDDLTVFIESGSVVIASPDAETGVVIDVSATRLHLSIYVPDDAAGFEGLLGDNDGDSANDLRARNGSVLDHDASRADYYEQFANTWRVSQGESLLHYESGETIATFTDETFPDLSAPGPSESALKRGEVLCLAAGVTDPVLLTECAYDYAVSGDIGFVQSAKLLSTLSDRVDALVDLASGSGTSETGEPVDGDVQVHESTNPWRSTMTNYREPSRVLFECPAGGERHTVWGGEEGIYTDDSSVCTAAVHAGLITFERGGSVFASTFPGLDAYPGVERNGVKTSGWGSWPRSFTLEGR